MNKLTEFFKTYGLFIIILLILIAVSWVVSIYWIQIMKYLIIGILIIIYLMFHFLIGSKFKDDGSKEVWRLRIEIASAIFLFGAFLATFLTYVNTATAYIIPIAYECPDLSLGIDDVGQTFPAVMNVGGALGSYQILVKGDNIILSKDYYRRYNDTFDSGIFGLIPKQQQTYKLFFKISNPPIDSPSFEIEWWDKKYNKIVGIKKCCYPTQDNSTFVYTDCTSLRK